MDWSEDALAESKQLGKKPPHHVLINVIASGRGGSVNFKCVLSKQWKKEQVLPFFGCCTGDSQSDASRHQLYRLGI